MLICGTRWIGLRVGTDSGRSFDDGWLLDKGPSVSCPLIHAASTMFFVHRHPALFGISIFLLAMLASCGGEKPDAALVGAMPVAEVQVAVVMPHEVTMSEDLPGRLEAIRVAQVRARVEGVVEKRLFAEGTDVKAGTSLYTIDARAYRAALAAAEAELTVANLTV